MDAIKKDAVLKRAEELATDILMRGLTMKVGDELHPNPSAEELDRLVSEYGLVLGQGAIRFPESVSAPV